MENLFAPPFEESLKVIYQSLVGKLNVLLGILGSDPEVVFLDSYGVETEGLAVNTVNPTHALPSTIKSSRMT